MRARISIPVLVAEAAEPASSEELREDVFSMVLT
jgi:hypothetical protein